MARGRRLGALAASAALSVATIVLAQGSEPAPEWAFGTYYRDSRTSGRRVFSPVFEYSTERCTALRKAMSARYGNGPDDPQWPFKFFCGHYTYPGEAAANRTRDVQINQWRTEFSNGVVEFFDLPFAKTMTAEERAALRTPGGSNPPAAALATPAPPPPPSARNLAVEAEVRRLGEHRRAEAERTVDMRLAAEEARSKALGPLAAAPRPTPAPTPTPTPRPTPSATPNPQDEVLAWREGVVLCQAPRQGTGDYTCVGPLQTTYGAMGKPSGTIAVNQACGISSGARDLGVAGIYRAFGCGYGTHPEDLTGRYPGNRDVPRFMGVDFVNGRATYRCKRRVSAYCKTQ